MALVLCALFAGAARGESVQSPGCARSAIARGDRLERTLDVDGVERSFIADVPASIDPNRPVPLLLDFHGFLHSAAGVWRVSGFRELGERKRFITIYPQGLEVRLLGRQGDGWELFAGERNRDVAFVRRILDWAEGEYCIDRRRVFATGFSNGAFLCHVLACTMADRVAAIAPVGGGLVEMPCDPGRPVAVMIHHGRNDAIVGVDRARELYEFWKKEDGCPGERSGEGCRRAADCRDGSAVVYCEGDGAHRWPVEATARIWEFFEQHPRHLRDGPTAGAR